MKFLFCLILLVLSSETAHARPLKQISIARIALEAQFAAVKISGNNNDWPDRVAPAGPDPHHHFDNHNWVENDCAVTLFFILANHSRLFSFSFSLVLIGFMVVTLDINHLNGTWFLELGENMDIRKSRWTVMLFIVQSMFVSTINHVIMEFEIWFSNPPLSIFCL
mgnify:FL=1